MCCCEEDASAGLDNSKRRRELCVLCYNKRIEAQCVSINLAQSCNRIKRLTTILGYGARHGIGNPIQLYPLYENAVRAHRNQSIKDNHTESAQLYADFAKVAEKNSYAWSYPAAAETAESIGTVSKRNRMICFPCE